MNYLEKEKVSDDFFWVIGGGLLQLPLISEVKRLGYKVIVSDRNPSCVCAKDADIFLEIDIFDVQKHLKEAFHLKSSGVKISGVLAAGIDATVTMAVLARSLGLPGVNPIIAHITNNKDIFRETIKKMGYPVPKFKVIGMKNFNDIESAIKEIGYPLIVKNTDSSGSRGTKIFYEDDLDGVKEAVKSAISVSRSKRALIEELWDGEEKTVETIFDINGKFHPCFITDRIFDKSNGYAIEIGLRHPTSLPPQKQKELYSLVEKVARDLGINIGAAKVDMMLTNKGPRIIEMTVRLSGGFDCQYLVPEATGKNILRAAILTALGKSFPLELLGDKKHKIGLTASIWPEPGKIVAIEGLEEVKKIPGFEKLFFRYNVGDIVEPYVDCTKRACFIIVTGKDEISAKKSLQMVLNTIKIKTKKGYGDE
jgi:biotin carboxylase